MAKFKVVRTWYVEAESTVDAVEKTKSFNHVQVKIKRLKEVWGGRLTRKPAVSKTVTQSSNLCRPE